MARILDGKATAAEVRAEVAQEVRKLGEDGLAVRLDVILVGEDPASVTYVRNKEKDCSEVGIESRVHRFSEGATQKELEEIVERLNEDEAVSGFFMQLPIPDHLDSQALISRIRPDKDVDGLNPESAGRLSMGLPALMPCTPHGVIQTSAPRRSTDGGPGKAVVLGRSNLVRQADGAATPARERHSDHLPFAHDGPCRCRKPGRHPHRRPWQEGDGRG